MAFAAVKERRFVNRGFLNGPICPIYGVGVVMVVQLLMPYKSNLFLLYVTSVIVVTALEWLTGFALDKIFHNKWWDYSGMPLNLNGYVCLLFSLIWGVACVAIVKWIHPLIYKGVVFLPVWLLVVLDLIFGIAILADLFATVSKILKVNKHLERMEEIAAELHRISDEIGQNISKGVLEVSERRDDISEEMAEKIAELKQKYR
ncbi:putative ABC transporter permease, partial [Fusobacterium ulcerans]|uniref:putative ABC transporter permease n=1 Tax=Fusobacterium ulcerans TaxID=861 RepID=UPI0026EC489A